MSILNELSRRRREQSALSDAVELVAEGIEKARVDIQRLESAVGTTRQSVRHGLYAFLVTVALILPSMLVLVVLLWPDAPNSPVVEVSVLARSKQDESKMTFSKVVFEPVAEWAHRTGDEDQFANCPDEEFAKGLDALLWEQAPNQDGNLQPPRARLTLAHIIRQERAGLVAVVVEAGHDARRLARGAGVDGNADLAKNRVTLLEEALDTALRSVSPEVQIVSVRRGATGADETTWCGDRKPRLTLIKHTTGSGQ